MINPASHHIWLGSRFCFARKKNPTKHTFYRLDSSRFSPFDLTRSLGHSPRSRSLYRMPCQLDVFLMEWLSPLSPSLFYDKNLVLLHGTLYGG